MSVSGKEAKDAMKTLIAPKYLLDTNIVLEAFWGKEPIAEAVKEWISEGQITVSAITVAEVLSKATKAEKEKLDLLIDQFGSLPADTTVARLAGEYRVEFSRKNKRVYLLDCLIAATAKLYDLTLVTKNITDYPMKDIEVLNP